MDFVVNPIALIVLIFGLVEFIKSLGVKGNILRLVSIIAGILVVVVFQLRSEYPQYQLLIDILFFGLATGLAASGYYDFFKTRIPKQP